MNQFFILVILAAVSVNMAYSRRRSLKHRDIDDEMCQSGDGSSYRGYVSSPMYSRKCLSWSRVKHSWGALEGVGPHNYCRNPDRSLMPWCFVRKGRRIVREFCSIPRCSTETIKLPTAVDTELTCGERSERKMHRIVGGSFTAIDSHPWVAAIYHKGRFLCGGSLIAPCWVVTAAHCFIQTEEIKTENLFVYLGKTAINETDADKEQSFFVKKLINHQEYNKSNYNNDIALLMIKGINGGCAVKSASARTVCLPPSHTHLPAGFQCSVAGFGKEKYGAWRYSQFLKQGEVKLLSRTDCKREPHYKELFTNNMICAASPDWSTDACEGDSGGPLVCEVSGRMFLFGVVSWGENCAEKNKPGVYTQVTNYNNWIAEKTGLQKYTKGKMYPTK
ncbi:plasminogen activator, urokinase a [Seriola aureovittata]|uniref:plasminogen activator, urokinase a n=1 Tax=Seriola aureovittata TaxID=2871759 RepID=UPI0024BD88A5|nr:plasminogen activator, urokinase a [Seriola aureovittata]